MYDFCRIKVTLRFFENIFGDGPMDVPADIAINMLLYQHYAKKEGYKMLLFDLESDPHEKNDISNDFPEIVNNLLKDVEELKERRPVHPRYWMMSPNWTKEGFVPGLYIHLDDLDTLNVVQ